MADSAVAITAGAGTNVDTRTEGTNGNHRQVMVLGDPATNAGVAPVDATAGLKVDLGADNDVTLAAVSTKHVVAAGSGDATSVKAAAGKLRSVYMFNDSAAPIYAKFHNTAGAPTPGAGVVLTVGVQAGVAFDYQVPGGGRSFATGIALTIVTGIADDDATGVTAEDCVVEVSYE